MLHVEYDDDTAVDAGATAAAADGTAAKLMLLWLVVLLIVLFMLPQLRVVLLLLLFVVIGWMLQLLVLVLVPVQLLMLLFNDTRVAASENEEDMEDAEMLFWHENISLVGNMGPLRECLRFPGASIHLVFVSCCCCLLMVAAVAATDVPLRGAVKSIGWKFPNKLPILSSLFLLLIPYPVLLGLLLHAVGCTLLLLVVDEGAVFVVLLL